MADFEVRDVALTDVLDDFATTAKPHPLFCRILFQKTYIHSLVLIIQLQI
jgi:hypothetical protein